MTNNIIHLLTHTKTQFVSRLAYIELIISSEITNNSMSLQTVYEPFYNKFDYNYKHVNSICHWHMREWLNLHHYIR